MIQRFANAARGVLASTIAPETTTIELIEGSDLFPFISENEWFKAVLQDADGIEIIRVNTRIGNEFTVDRGQEGTMPRAFSAGTVVGLRITAEDIEGVIAAAKNSVQLTGQQTIDGLKFFNGTIFAFNEIVGNLSGSITGNAATATALETARTINGVSFNGSADITVMANTPNSLTFNNAGIGAASGATFDGSTSRTISHNTVGAPSASGGGAFGTWNIDISGNAGTVNNGVYRSGNQTIGGNKSFTGSVLVISSTGGALGYGAGAGGMVTQATSKSTTVTLNRPCGQITMNNAALGANTAVTFMLGNTLITPTDTVLITVDAVSIATRASYRCDICDVGSGNCAVRITNITAGSLSEAVRLNFAIIKGATS